MRTGYLLILWILLAPEAPRCAAAGYYNYQIYPGNEVGGAVGNGTLALSNNNYSVYANFIKGIGSFDANLVMFIDCAPGGFTSTALFNDKDNALEIAVSGTRLSRSVATFAPGFAADYAVVVGINSGSALFKLVDDATGPHLELVSSALNFQNIDTPNHPSYSFQFDWVSLGLPEQRTNFFKFETSYISNNGYRWLESFEGLTGKIGYDFVTFTNYDTFGVPPVPENSNVALAAFGAFVLAVAVGNARCRLKQHRPPGS